MTAGKQANRCTLNVEDLEGRDLLANYLILDFTPDAILGERYVPGSFRGNYNVTYTSGRSPAFLDMDGNGWVNGNDAAIAANRITARVKQLLKGYNVKIKSGDFNSDTGAGAKWLNWGLQSPNDLVSVIYVGGYNTTGRPGTTGIAAVASPGENVEHYGYAFTASIARHLAQFSTAVSSSYFINECAATIAHEFGHLMGLYHVYGHPANDPGQNIMNYSANPNYKNFTNATYYVELNGQYVGTQNPALELVRSLSGGQPHRGSPNRYSANVMSAAVQYSEMQPIDEHAQGEEVDPEGHGHCCCGGCQAASETQFSSNDRIRTAKYRSNDDTTSSIPLPTRHNLATPKQLEAEAVVALELSKKGRS